MASNDEREKPAGPSVAARRSGRRSRPASEWSKTLSRNIGVQVRRLRTARGLTVVRLAEMTAESGHRLDRMAITNLEAGERETVTIAEMLILAYALGVPPVLLAMPVGNADTVEILPGRRVSPGWALLWFSGERSLRGDVPVVADPLSAVVAVYRNHDVLLQRLRQGMQLVAQDPDHEQGYGLAETAHRSVRFNREELRREGYALPALPADLAWIELVEPSLPRVPDESQPPPGFRRGEPPAWAVPGHAPDGDEGGTKS